MTNKKLKNSLNERLIHNESKLKNQLYLRQPRQGLWEDYTWGTVVEKARRVAAYLLELGLKMGDKIAICSKNCAEWYIVDFGISLAGLITVPLFPNQRDESIHFVLVHAEVRAIFVGKLDDPLRISASIPKFMPIISLGYHDNLTTAVSWQTILATKPLTTVFYPTKEDIFSIIYTSGTAGSPKGVVYTHGKIAAYLALYCKDIKTICDLPIYRFLSYLPLAHIYERASIELGSVVLPCTVSFVESLDKFVDNLREIQPTFFTGVPRIWTVFHSKITKKIPEKKLNTWLKIPVFSYFLRRKIKQELGFSHCENYFSGASHLPVSLQTFFEKIGIKIQEGYGQTEDLAYATVTYLNNYRQGSVGSPRYKVKIKLTSERELLIKSPCLMDGYYKDSAATEAALTKDGWLHTGDIAAIDEKKRVKILDRLSDIFKNQYGEFISPNEIEEFFASIDYFEQLCLIGKNYPSNILVATLSTKGRNIGRDLLVNNLQMDLKKINHQLMNYERVAKILLVLDQWLPENGFLTPTFKVKRVVVEAQYHALIEQALHEPGLVYWPS